MSVAGKCFQRVQVTDGRRAKEAQHPRTTRLHHYSPQLQRHTHSFLLTAETKHRGPLQDNNEGSRGGESQVSAETVVLVQMLVVLKG